MKKTSARAVRRGAAVLGALAAVLTFVMAPSASGDTMRDNVSGDALTPFRALAAPYADPSSLGPEWSVLKDVNDIACIADIDTGMGAMGVHFVNHQRALDGVIDPAKPDILVYEPRPAASLYLADGSLNLSSLHLVALDYFVLESQVPAAPEIFAGHPFGHFSAAAAARFKLPPFYTQHLWVAKGNPSGNLAMWNPAVHCE